MEKQIAALLRPQVLSRIGNIGDGLEEVLLASAAEVGAEDTHEQLLNVVLMLSKNTVRRFILMTPLVLGISTASHTCNTIV